METAPSAEDYRDMLRRVRILIVGGGAIGQVFGCHLQKGGAEVSYLLKPRYAADAEEGFDLHRYGLAGLRPRRHLQPEHVFTDHRRLRAHTFDQVWLCVSSPALRTGLVDDLVSSCDDPAWVSFQPGLEDRKYLLKHVPANKLVTGLVNYIAYQSPLPGEDLWPEGIAYFVPPFSMTQFSGPEPFASAAANLLQEGGLNAGVRPDAATTAKFGSSVLVPFVVALESVGWSWAALRKNDAVLTLMTESIRDLQTAIEKASGAFAGSMATAQRKFAWKMALFWVPKVASFPIEPYFEYHFTKVREQSDQMIDDFAQLCRDNAIISSSLESLRAQWRARRKQLPREREQIAKTEPALDPRESAALAAAVSPASRPAPAASTPAASAPAAPAPSAPSPDASTPAGRPQRETVVEPTRPMAMPGAPPPEVAATAPAPADDRAARSDVDAIEVDFDFEGDEAPQVVAGSGQVPTSEGLEAPTDDVIDDGLLTPAPDASSAKDHRDSIPELDVILEPAPLEPEIDDEDKPGKPVLRSLNDLADVPAIDAPEPSDVEEDPSTSLPFQVDEPDLPSIMVAEELGAEEVVRETQKTIRTPDPGEVHFRDAVPTEKKQELQRQDFIQTEFANEKQNADLRSLKDKLRARMKGDKALSPALRDDSDS